MFPENKAMPRKEHRFEEGVEQKHCKCDTWKPLNEFGKNKSKWDGLQGMCKECKITENKKILKSKKKWRERNRNKVLEINRKYRENNKEKTKKYYSDNREKILCNHRRYYKKNAKAMNTRMQKYYRDNREKVLQQCKKYRERPDVKTRKNTRHVERRRTEPNYKLITNMRSRLWEAMKGKSKSTSTMKLVGCTIEFLKQYLENQFVDGMTWDNYGPVWHCEHMLPCESFDFTDPEQQRRCFHYTNLQPMFAPENISKGAKILYNREWTGKGWIDSVSEE